MDADTKELQQNLIVLSVDVEWASPEILADMVHLLDERKLPATFFCTHPGISVPGHERALHPNFRRSGDTVQQLYRKKAGERRELTDGEVYEHVVHATHAFCPEAIGVRGHSLFYNTEVLPIYRQAGLEYDSSYFLPLEANLRPVWNGHNMLEIPLYYMDHHDIIVQASGFRLEGLHLDRPGVKVFDFHPNMVFANLSTNTQYENNRDVYHQYEQLLERRRPGRGVRTLFLELLDLIASRELPIATLGTLNAAWRSKNGAT
jgi:hypothetical protein